MRYIITLISIVAISMVSITARSEERLAILEFRNNDKAVSTSELTYLGELFRDLSAKMGKRGLVIMTKENILQLLPPGKSLEQCSGECEVETGRNIGADYILSGEVIKLTSGYRLTAKVHNTKTGGLMGSEIYEGKTFDLLEKDIRGNASKDVFRPLKLFAVATEFQEKTFGEKVGSMQAWEDSTTIVQFDTAPKGAFVEIDGTIVCQQTPCSKEVKMGSHEIAFKLMQYLPLTEQIEVKKDITPITRTLKADFGLVTLKTEPNDGLEVFLDNKSIGETPLSTFKVEPRPHKLVVKSDGYYEKGIEFKIERGQSREFVLKPDQKLGALKITAKDNDGNDVVAKVSIDDTTVGSTPWQGNLAVGNHTIEVINPTGVWRENYLIKFNEKQHIFANLKKQSEEQNQVRRVYRHGVWVKAGDLLYKDTTTGLTWTRFDGKERNWQDAIDYCKNSTFGGVRGWRLPEKDMLLEAYNNGIWDINDPAKLNLAYSKHAWFWSASTYSTGYEWGVVLRNGTTDNFHRGTTNGVLCVR